MRAALAALPALALAACGFHPGKAASDGSTPSPDSSDSATGDAPLGAWSTPTPVVELDSTTGDDDPSLTDDLLEIYFGSKRPGGQGLEDIWTARRAAKSDSWGTPVPVTELNSAATDTTTKVSGDGLTIMFSSARGGNFDIYYSIRGNRTLSWSPPVLVTELSTSDGDYCPFPSNDRQHVVFCRGDVTADEDILTSQRPSDTALWGTPTSVPSIDVAGASDCDPMMPHARVLYFSSNRNGTDYDLYLARRAGTSGGFDPPATIPELESSQNDRDPWVSPDERLMYFTSQRDTGYEHIFVTTR